MCWQLIYFAKEALRSLKAFWSLAFLTISSLTVALLVLGGYLLILHNLQQLTQVLRPLNFLTVYLQDGVILEEAQQLVAEVAKWPEIEKSTLITSQEALARFKQRGPDLKALAVGIEADSLPWSLEIFLKQQRNSEVPLQVAQALTKLPLVTEVDYGQEDFLAWTRFTELIRYVGIGLLSCLGGGVFLLICNTWKLWLYARKEEIAILRLVGATNWFIIWPCLYEGLFSGLLAVLLAVSGLMASERYLSPLLSKLLTNFWGSFLGELTISLFTYEIALYLLGLGLFLGVFSSFISVRYFLSQEV